MMKVTVKDYNFTEEEVQQAILLTKKRWGTRLPENLTLILEKQDGQLIVTFDPPIDRQVYRSTDYLVNHLGKLNSGKSAEHADKVSHITA